MQSQHCTTLADCHSRAHSSSSFAFASCDELQLKVVSNRCHSIDMKLNANKKVNFSSVKHTLSCSLITH